MLGVCDCINSIAPNQLSIFTGDVPGVVDFGSAAAFVLSVPGPCSDCALGIPASVPGSCSDGALEFPVSVPGSCSDGVLGIPASVQESCSASALGVAVCVLATTSDICSEHLEVASALLVGDF